MEFPSSTNKGAQMRMDDFQIEGMLPGSLVRISGQHVVCIETNVFCMRLHLSNGVEIRLTVKENAADIRAVEDALRKHK